MKQKTKTPLQKGIAKVPIVMQLEALECGAASLSMILAYYGKWIPLERVRTDCGVSRDGAKASNILRAARSYGLTASGVRFEPLELRDAGTFPCIIHWNFNHFVVLTGFSGNKAYLNDPAKGSCIVTMEEFDAAFTGVCLLFAPADGFAPEGKPRSTLSFIKKRLIGMGPAIVFVGLTAAVIALLNVANPAFSRVFLDRLLTGENPDWTMPFLFMLTLLTALLLGVSWVQEANNYKLCGKLSIMANASFLWHVLRMPMEFFSQRMAGDVAQRQTLNETISASLIHTFAPLVLQTGMMVFYFVAMLRYSLLLTTVGIASILLNLIMAQIISKKRVNITRVQMRDVGKLAGTTVAGIEMIETIKASGAENGFFEKWAGYQAGANTQTVKFARVNHYLGLIPTLISALTAAAILMLGVYFTMQGEFSVGMIMAFQGFLLAFTAPAQMLISAGQVIQEMRTNMERVEDVLEYPADVNYDTTLVPTASYAKLRGELVMRDIRFGYSPLGAPLIEHFDLQLTPGSCVAFVGPSGCGKSTLSKLISGLYKPWSGEILFDGKPISAIDHCVFTGSVAVVDQDVILFEDSIGSNIRMWDSSIEDFEVILAARDACLHEEIMSRDGGYSYPLLEGGKNLSGGQRQRMEIARVLAQDPTLIIMDEATSALDAKTEFDVITAIKDRGITCIVIAHRLSTIRDCDEIIVLDKGKVVERGTHNDLYTLGGLYTSLISNE